LSCDTDEVAGVGVPVEEDLDAHVVGIREGDKNHEVPPLVAGAYVVHFTWRKQSKINPKI